MTVLVRDEPLTINLEVKESLQNLNQQVYVENT